MARKKRKSTRRRGRRRIGAVGKSNIMSAVGIVAGAVVGRMIVKKVLPNVDEKIKNAGIAAVGALVMPNLLKSDLGKALGNGMIAAGGIGLVGSFIPALGAVEETIDFPVTVGEIEDGLSVVAGDESVMAGDNLSVLAGMDDDEDDY